MHLKAEKKIVLTSLWLVIGMSLATSACYASSFYTIIGPDGHPMIIQKPESSTKSETKQKNNEKNENKTEKSIEAIQPQSSTTQNKNVTQPERFPTSAPEPKKSVIPLTKHSSEIQTKSQQTVKVSPQPQKTVSSSVQPDEQEKTAVVVPETKTAEIAKSQHEAKQVEKQQKSLTTQNSQISKAALKTQSIQETEDKNFTIIDGEKYVNNEYLEDREFNLEGKKRFYMTPEIGAVHGRYETIERQKGLSTSLLNRIRGNPDADEKKPVVLSSTYFRLPKDEVVHNLEQACFTGKKILKAKGLSLKNQEIGLWPVAPIKAHFAYEVVKLDAQVQNILLTSYASSSKTQTYYWPLVVFLDEQGCVIEGVSGFKNEESHDNNLQYAAMEGVLRKPEKATYLFLTPLSSAIDVENKQLTNHGQIKLSVIQ
ncbi:putative pilus assembly protein FilE [Acinetobacter bereziniae]|uniref:putative pilus assembly protein FilE n=1 Tax=Acinetobacter bereziniae TaxID=106648 RepID=UPI001580AF76|nr:putative pilus assembly protein FilE [Acinetobacter bereziniae]NUF62132.1 putative pilus assembly protein FilE [Acinetobacter bereziniae]NUG05924.1 putative pilus assembly protein FilE [Acinetobacter bereziniae]NUG62167.1 putative pilus assembly protein FilE [Acinetobacter bereziniae]NUG68172.1 putative pilus assembly protein FilE [Acinetobacter bereziniae]NUG79697.1 putative pilus assembly protein FilE [Acinetobacter bereziniae]